jgi:hypothetical protein
LSGREKPSKRLPISAVMAATYAGLMAIKSVSRDSYVVPGLDDPSGPMADSTYQWVSTWDLVG